MEPTNKAVTWAVQGVAGGNAAVGNVYTTGVYTAPAALPNPTIVTVRATSVASPTKFGEANGANVKLQNAIVPTTLWA